MANRNKDLVNLLDANGWRVVKGKHVKCYCPCGDHIVVVSSSASDRNAHRQNMRIIRKCPQNNIGAA